MNYRSVLASALVAVAVAACGNATSIGGPDTAASPAAGETMTTMAGTAFEPSPSAVELQTRCEVMQAHADFRTGEWFPSVDEALEWASQRSPHGFVRAGSAATSEPAVVNYVRRVDGEMVEVAEVVVDAEGRWSVDAIETCG